MLNFNKKNEFLYINYLLIVILIFILSLTCVSVYGKEENDPGQEPLVDHSNHTSAIQDVLDTMELRIRNQILEQNQTLNNDFSDLEDDIANAESKVNLSQDEVNRIGALLESARNNLTDQEAALQGTKTEVSRIKNRMNNEHDYVQDKLVAEMALISKIRNMVTQFQDRRTKSYGETCGTVYRCEDDLTCDREICKVRLGESCNATRECSSATRCMEGVCLFEILSKCTHTSQCAHDYTCNQGKCRHEHGGECSSDEECIQSLACVENRCIEATQEFLYTGEVQTKKIPEGVSSITIEAWGAEGGQGEPDPGVPGKGGWIKSVHDVNPGQSLSVIVGGRGHDAQDQNEGGGGGGRTQVSLDGSVIVVGGAGGGASGRQGNNADHLKGRDGGHGGYPSGDDGESYGSVTGGGGGTQNSGGRAGSGSYNSVSSGSKWNGGEGGSCCDRSGGGGYKGGGDGGSGYGGGGGGGAGYYGGGGGNGGQHGDYHVSGGGGGGSSYSNGSQVEYGNGVQSGHGKFSSARNSTSPVVPAKNDKLVCSKIICTTIS